MSKTELDARLWHWAAWCIKFEKNEMGWPEESATYRFMREGFSNDKNKSRTSSEPYKPHPEAEQVQNLFNLLKLEDCNKADTLYLYYVHNVSVRRMSMAENINWRTVYKRIQAAKTYIANGLSIDPRN
jgi:hypothetical protein